MADAYRYMGPRERIYFQYLDLATDKVLTVFPGQEYEMRPVDFNLPLPPDDWWEAVPEELPAPEKPGKSGASDKSDKQAGKPAPSEKGE